MEKRVIKRARKIFSKGILGKIYRYLQSFYSVNVCNIKGTNLVYIPLSKNANTTIRTIIYELNEGISAKGVNIYSQYNFPRINRFKLKKTYNFTFVRNPYDRLISFYQEKVKKNDPRIKQYGLNSEMSFEDFVRIICKVPDNKLDKHANSQYYQIKNLKIDFIGKVGNLDKDLKKVLSKANLTIKEIPQKNKSKKILSRHDISEELKDLIYQRYKNDFQKFNYSR